jgi:hypothetical protein
MPALYLTTKDKVKAHAGITGSGDDTILATLCEQITAFIERYTARTVTEVTVEDEIHDADDFKHYLRLNRFPIKEMTALEERDDISDTTWATIPADEYDVEKNKGVIYFEDRRYGKRNISASYKAGLMTVPLDLELIATKLVAKIYNKRKSEGITREQMDAASVDWAGFLQDEDKLILDSYKRSALV